VVAMAGTWLWMRELGRSSPASVFAAVGFALSLSFSQWLFFPHTAVFCLWPWILFLVERRRDRARSAMVFAALVAALAFAALAGHPESLVLGALFTGLWIVVRWAAGEGADGRRIARDFAFAGLAAMGLTAFLLFPSALAIRASNRFLQAHDPYWLPLLSWVPHGPVWRGLATAVLPYALGDLIHAPVLSGATGAVPEMDLGYFGIAGLFAALLILRPGSRRDPRAWILLALFVAGLGVAAGQWPVAELAAAIPAVRHMFPLRFYSWVALAGPALGAFELDRYARDAASARRPLLGMVIPAGLLGAAVVGIFEALRPESVAAGSLAFLRQQALLALGLIALAALLLFGLRRAPAVAIGGVAVLTAGELLARWQGLYRPSAPSLLYPETGVVRFLKGRAAPFRVVGSGGALFPNMGIFANAEDVRTHDPVERADYVAFLNATCGFPPADYFKHVRDFDAPVLDFLNVAYLVHPPEETAHGERWTEIYRGRDGAVAANLRVLPRAFVPERVTLVEAPAGLSEPLADANAAFGPAFGSIAGNRDWAGHAWILWYAAGETSGGSATVTDYRESTNAIEVRARVAPGSPAAVVLSVVQDGGWSARDASGARVELRRANGPFMAAVLNPGDHAVHLTYRPPGFVAGAIVGAVTAAVLVACSLRARRPRRVAA
jgi:hypothetical protein